MRSASTRRERSSPRERRLIARLRTPLAVQRYLNRLPYNQEPHGRATLRSFRGVVRHGCAHCLEAALFAAVVLEQHGYPPLVLSFESIDELDHVIFVYRQRGTLGIGRALARSRPARPPAGVRDAARARAQLRRSVCRLHRPRHGLRRRRLARSWATTTGGWPTTNVWKVERMLLDYPHRPIAIVGRARQAAARTVPRLPRGARWPQADLLRGRERWTPLPTNFCSTARVASHWSHEIATQMRDSSVCRDSESPVHQTQHCFSRDRSRASAW